MTRSDLDATIKHFEDSIEAHVTGHWYERSTWHAIKGWLLAPARVADLERRLIDANVIEDDAPKLPPAA